MKVITSVDEMRAESAHYRSSGRTVALVPTMGALHEGHLSLIRKARELTDRVVVSVFVNPIQFGPSEDLDSYPADLLKDRAMCEAEDVAVLFHPARAEMYSPVHSTYVVETDMSAGLCGKSRPGHFRGVTTVVAKIFNIVLPDVAVFGRKDAQQARVIERMVRDLNFPVRIIIVPIVRESNGLAMSSRNAYLSGDERTQAACLHEAIELAETLYAQGVRATDLLKKNMLDVISRWPAAEIEYVEIVDYGSLKPVREIGAPALVALCVRFGRTRLIDNTVLGL